MKKTLAVLCSLALLILLAAQPQSVKADNKASSITTKTLSYKGQQYVQISVASKAVTQQINKILKLHAVNAAVSNSAAKKQSKNGSFKATPSTKYNKNNRLSIVYSDYYYTGGAHGMLASVSYNFDVQTGKQIRLKDILTKDYQKDNLEIALANELAKKSAAGENVFPDSAYSFTLDMDNSFYFYDKGIVYQFQPYEVAPYGEGFVDIKIPYETINQQTEAPFSLPNKNNIADSIKQDPNYAETSLKGDFTGFQQGKIYELANGQKWKQISDQTTSANVSHPEVIVFPYEGDIFLVIEGQTVMPIIEKVE
ncbi:DUF3298 and DUF4163 domain-containing protein [Paenibacillus macerans]|uniref:DUF3298 and DUF4163 domain-containing protein n=1 Tax=Paenibacillus macerans TaxID=44252 RepID=UPI00203CA223|nr:DUF3298 and DUF4163 domain-containing protein [Paenibacillus macerans]MCM3701458.1 DUF3298 and DUF4163 domain-containing protein [Paenibacillus macerans]